MGMKITFDPRAIVAKMAQVGERAEKGGAEALHKGAKEIQKRARMYSPLDHGGLEHAIEYYSDRSGINRRRVFYVYINPDAPELNSRGEPTGRTVERYAMYMHEGDYNLGKRSQAKAASLGVEVGPKFLERAADEVMEELNDAIAEQLRRIF